MTKKYNWLEIRILSLNLKTMQFDLQKLKLHPWRVEVGQWEGSLVLHDKNKILGLKNFCQKGFGLLSFWRKVAEKLFFWITFEIEIRYECKKKHRRVFLQTFTKTCYEEHWEEHAEAWKQCN